MEKFIAYRALKYPLVYCISTKPNFYRLYVFGSRKGGIVHISSEFLFGGNPSIFSPKIEKNQKWNEIESEYPTDSPTHSPSDNSEFPTNTPTFLPSKVPSVLPTNDTQGESLFETTDMEVSTTDTPKDIPSQTSIVEMSPAKDDDDSSTPYTESTAFYGILIGGIVGLLCAVLLFALYWRSKKLQKKLDESFPY